MPIVLAHLGHAAIEPLLLLAVPAAVVAAWEWRDRRRPVPVKVRTTTSRLKVHD